MSSPTTTTQTPLRVGVLYEDTQMTDLAGLDLLGNLTPKTIDLVATMLPSFLPLKARAIPMTFLYISSSLDLATTTPEMRVQPTHTYATAPRDLDILLLGGPDPMAVHPDSLTFLKEASRQTKVILTTCTGGMWLARAGVLDGKRATTNRVMLDLARQVAPGVEWVDQRWVVDEGHFEGAQLWTAGGAGCGIDMFIEYTHQTFDKQLVELGCMGLDFDLEGRSQFYKGPLPSLG
ncbi:class I glutamine amidotransferase-like protein [Pyrenochaeta sp. DS3sAY3a]|nr:class I glutamine amidotransferase-like protein [Pyrenochaeta sp. DS3sAY3a]